MISSELFANRGEALDSSELILEDTVMMKRVNHLVRSYYSHGGHLVLTNRRLVFTPHRFNIRARMVSIELGDIAGIGKSSSMLDLSKQIWVRTRKGPVIRFVVRKIAELIDAVKRQIIPESRT
ncbi:MAG TPA: hypothetical protein VFE98_11485 [Candidatus Bathyarchaeia archaeon]|nr:hypothetical protein [Candidatus Bathyarchaeia archaeon]